MWLWLLICQAASPCVIAKDALHHNNPNSYHLLKVYFVPGNLHTLAPSLHKSHMRWGTSHPNFRGERKWRSGWWSDWLEAHTAGAGQTEGLTLAEFSGQEFFLSSPHRGSWGETRQGDNSSWLPDWLSRQNCGYELSCLQSWILNLSGNSAIRLGSPRNLRHPIRRTAIADPE